MRSENLKKPIAEIYGKSTFLKVKNDYFTIGKVLFSFVQWKEKSQGSQVEKQINCSIDMDEALLLAHEVLLGHVQECLKGLRDDGFAWKSQIGGVHEKEAARKNLRNDGKAIARYFGIQTSKTQYCRFSAMQCAAHTAENGLIVPERGAGMEAVTVPVASEDALKILACGIIRAVMGYEAGLYASCYEELEKERESFRRGEDHEAVKKQGSRREVNCDCYWSVARGSQIMTRGKDGAATILRMIVKRIGEDVPLPTDEAWQLAEVVIFEKALRAADDKLSSAVRELITKAGEGVDKGVIKDMPLEVGEIRDGMRQLIFRGRRDR